MYWSNLTWFDSGEHQVVSERILDAKLKGILSNPRKDLRYQALRLIPIEKVRVVILGQDPYPDPKYCTGIAFSIPKDIPKVSFPKTLDSIFKEYVEDLHYPYPTSGDLTPWSSQGVLLWNVIPTCEAYKSLSHDWVEYELLTQEVLKNLLGKNIVFVFLGAVAKRPCFFNIVKDEITLRYSHPSPRGSLNSLSPFKGSRMFSTINAKLKGEPINWRLI